MKHGVLVVLVDIFYLKYSGCVGAIKERCSSSSQYCATCAVADIAMLTPQQLEVRLILRQHPDNHHFAACIT